MPTAVDEKVEFLDAPTEGPLRGVVGSMVGYRMRGQQPTLHRGVPSPTLTFIVNLDTPIVAGTHGRADEDGSAHAYDNLLGGLHTSAAYIFQPERQAGIQLAVHPLAARRLFGVPARELVEASNDAADVLGDGVRRLQHQVGEGPSWQQRFATVEQYLLDRASAAPSFAAPRTEVAAAWRWMVAHRGMGRMDDLARHVLLSGRQLSKLFRAELGVPPKVVNRLIRFDRARQAIQAQVVTGDPSGFTEVAHACGYYDHAHLVRDFQAFLGCSPTTWLAEEGRNIQAGGHHHGEGLNA
ncbi:helix-turn-helix domain-containing protein [Nocardioides sp.]|uniref:AraC family transcriptional regulator n=1 Tax=Nocardioides sp. TaxID=35761 RepID=UPI002ED61585